MYCPSCGGEIEDNAQFCEHCGASIEEANSAPTQQPQTETETAGQRPSGQGQPPNTGGRQGQGQPRNNTTNARGGTGGQGAYGQGHAQGRQGGAQTGQVAGGLEPNIAAALSYALGIVTGIIFFLIEEENQFVRFHAAQSIVVFGGLFVLNFGLSIFVGVIAGVSGVYGLFSLLSTLLSLASLVAWLVLMFKAYSGEWFRVPVAAGIADDLM